MHGESLDELSIPPPLSEATPARGSVSSVPLATHIDRNAARPAAASAEAHREPTRPGYRRRSCTAEHRADALDDCVPAASTTRPRHDRTFRSTLGQRWSLRRGCPREPDLVRSRTAIRSRSVAVRAVVAGSAVALSCRAVGERVPPATHSAFSVRSREASDLSADRLPHRRRLSSRITQRRYADPCSRQALGSGPRATPPFGPWTNRMRGSAVDTVRSNLRAVPSRRTVIVRPPAPSSRMSGA